MQLINLKDFQPDFSSIKFSDFTTENFLNNSELSPLIKNYIFLSEFAHKMVKSDPLNIYYNRYFWFVKFLSVSNQIFGYDASLEQMEFKILEEGEQFEDIDWGIVEKISNDVKNDSSNMSK
jgi:hypothetical protein